MQNVSFNGIVKVQFQNLENKKAVKDCYWKDDDYAIEANPNTSSPKEYNITSYYEKNDIEVLKYLNSLGEHNWIHSEKRGRDGRKFVSTPYNDLK